MYIKLIDGAVVKYPYSVAMFRLDNPQLSLPDNVSDKTLESFGVFPVRASLRPEVDYTKNVAEGVPAQQNGSWVQVWNVTDATAEEVAQRTDDEASQVRSERNQRLTESDWTQVADAPVDKQVWAAYRQELRNVPDQAGFPFNIQWPQTP